MLCCSRSDLYTVTLMLSFVLKVDILSCNFTILCCSSSLISVERHIWHHTCVSLSFQHGFWKTYQDGKMSGFNRLLSAEPIIPGKIFMQQKHDIYTTFSLIFLMLSMQNRATQTLAVILNYDYISNRFEEEQFNYFSPNVDSDFRLLIS